MLILLYFLFFQDVRNLGHDDFFVRERTQAKLTKIAWLVFPLLDREFKDPEINVRAKRIIKGELSHNFPVINAIPLPGQNYCGGWQGDFPRVITERKEVLAIQPPYWLYMRTPLRYRYDEECVYVCYLASLTGYYYRCLRYVGIPHCCMQPVLDWMMTRQNQWRR